MSGMTTRKRSLLRSGKKRGRENGDGDGGDEENSPCDLGCPHAGMVGRMKREITELKGALEEERRLRSEALRARTKSRSSFPPRDPSDASACPPSGDASAALGRATYELEVCRRDLEDAKRALHEALDEREAMRLKLSESAASADSRPSLGARGLEAGELDHPHLDWVGRHYLAVSLPRIACSDPRVRDSRSRVVRQTPGFGFTARAHANGYVSTDKVETEDFAWLLFEYGAQAPFVEVLAGLLNVLSSTSKGGVTTVALQLGKSLYAAGVALFRETVSRASEAFARVRERARRVREAQGSVSVPLTAGLQEEHSDLRRGWAQSRNTALRSVLEGIEVPAHLGIRSSLSRPELNPPSLEGDPFSVDRSLAAFIKSRSSEGRGGRAAATGARTSCGILPLRSPRVAPPGRKDGLSQSECSSTRSRRARREDARDRWPRTAGRGGDEEAPSHRRRPGGGPEGPGDPRDVQVLPRGMGATHGEAAHVSRRSLETRPAERRRRLREVVRDIDAGDQAEGSEDQRRRERHDQQSGRRPDGVRVSGQSAHSHKLMGFKKELLDDALSPEDFVERYRRTYRDAISRFEALCGSGEFLRRAIDRHSCERLRPGSCAVCSGSSGS
ncbi:hypothetical protein Q5P01_000943 [Channa striata]|uniref:Uncharacterized protein n=1 Tax=Channa striata TaxID=64152 RepID=A0AA88IYG4_CHASR|nr:hypothetical protein Q5P01_000943 [Channa striata]